MKREIEIPEIRSVSIAHSATVVPDLLVGDGVDSIRYVRYDHHASLASIALFSVGE